MIGIEWLSRGILIDKNVTVVMSEAEAIASAQRRAVEVAKRHPERRPDSFRLTDATGRVFGVFPTVSTVLSRHL